MRLNVSRNSLKLLSIISFIILWTGFVSFVGPQTIIEKIGVENGYVILFLIGVIVGVTSFGGVYYYSILGTLAIIGLNPYLLGLIGGLGISISDFIFYYVGAKGREVTYTKIKKTLDKLTHFFQNSSDIVIFLVIFLITGFTPFPSDLLMIAIAFAGYPFKKILFPMVLGNITSSTILVLILQETFSI